MGIAFPAKESTDSHRARRSSWLTSVAGDDRVAVEVVGVQQIGLLVQWIASPLLMIVARVVGNNDGVRRRCLAR